MAEDYTTTNWEGHVRYECLRMVNGNQCNYDVLDDEAAVKLHIALSHQHDVQMPMPAAKDTVVDEREPYTIAEWCGHTQYKCKHCPFDVLDDDTTNGRVEMYYHYDKRHYAAIQWQRHLDEESEEYRKSQEAANQEDPNKQPEQTTVIDPTDATNESVIC